MRTIAGKGLLVLIALVSVLGPEGAFAATRQVTGSFMISSILPGCRTAPDCTAWSAGVPPVGGCSQPPQANGKFSSIVEVSAYAGLTGSLSWTTSGTQFDYAGLGVEFFTPACTLIAQAGAAIVSQGTSIPIPRSARWIAVTGAGGNAGGAPVPANNNVSWTLRLPSA